MKYLNIFLAALLSLGLFAILPGCDGDLDDDSADDDTGDDDTWPEYTGTIDLDTAILTGGCTVEVASVSDGQDPPPEGYFQFDIEMDGWADICWIEMWDDTSPYCEGYDTETGDPCEYGGQVRPGWDMNQGTFGYDGVHWDSWYLDLDYLMVWPPEPDASLFICENAGNNFGTYFCCCDLYDTSECYCAEFVSW